MKRQKKVRLLTGNITALYLHYLFPSVTAAVMISINYFIDALCIGRKMGELGLSALSIAGPASGVMYALGFLFGMGGSTLFSANMGQGKKRRAQECYTLSLLSLVALSILAGAAAMVFLRPITLFLGGGGASYQGAADYLTYVFSFAPVLCLETFFAVFVTNDRAPRISMAATLLSCFVNSVLDIYFVFVLEWGMAGASLATSLGTGVGLVVLASSTLRASSSLKPRRVRLRWRTCLCILRTGLPSFVQQMTPSVVMLTFNNVLLTISGEMAVAVYGIIGNVGIIVNAALGGAGEAMHPIVSANAGAEKQYRVRGVLRVAFFCTLAMTALIVLVCQVWAGPIVGLFIKADKAFLDMALPGLRITAVSYFAVAVNVLLTLYFQSVEASGEALMLSLVRGVAFPVAGVLFCALFFGIRGVWASVVLSEFFALLLSLFYLRRVQARLRERNYQKLNFFTSREDREETLDQILDQLGAEDLTAFIDLIHYCGSRDEDTEGIPAYIGLDDLTSDYEGDYRCAEADEGYGLWLAIGALLFTDLFEQNEEYMREKLQDLNYPAAAPAMSALAELCFRFDYEERTGKTTVIPYRDAVKGFVTSRQDVPL